MFQKASTGVFRAALIISNETHQRISQAAQMVKNLPAMQDTWVPSLGQEDPLEKGMAPHCSILAWKIPQRSLAGYSPWGRKEDMTERLTVSLFRCMRLKTQNRIVAAVPLAAQVRVVLGSAQ